MLTKMPDHSRYAQESMTERQIASAVPDAITCGFFITAWIAPHVLSMEVIKNLKLVFLIEFFILFATIFYSEFTYDPDSTRSKKISDLLTITAILMIFIIVLSNAAKAWWPVAVFAWLLLSHIGTVIWDRLPDEMERKRLRVRLTASMLLFFGCFLGILLLPVLGFVDVKVVQRGASQVVVWKDQQFAVWGVIYFGGNSLLILFNAYRAFFKICIWIAITAMFVLLGWVFYWLLFVRYSY